MKNLLLSVASIALFFNPAVYAHDKSSAYTKVKSIYSKNDGSAFITFEAGKLPGCHSNSGAYISSGTDINKLYSTVLAAKLADKKLKVYYNFNDVSSRPADYAGWGLCYIEAVSVY